MDYLTVNGYTRTKNKWNSQRIQQKFKNRHHNEYDENDIDKKYWKRKNRINMKKTSKIIETHVQQKSSKKCDKLIKHYFTFQVSVVIGLVNKNKNIYALNVSDSKLITYKLKNATIDIHETSKRMYYLSYSFIPCYKYTSSQKDNNIYELRNDIQIPLFFNEQNNTHHTNIFNNNTMNVNQSLFKIAQKCWNERNPFDYNMEPEWNISNIKTNKNMIYITVNSTIRIKNDDDNLTTFIKHRPFTKDTMHTLNIFDPVNHKRLHCDLITKNKKDIYCNVPILLNAKQLSMKSLHNDLKYIIIEKKESEPSDMIQTTKLTNDNQYMYWFCDLCFTMNVNTKNNTFKCKHCNKIFLAPITKDYSIQSKEHLYQTCKFGDYSISNLASNIMNMVLSYEYANQSECIINRKFTESFLKMYVSFKQKYKNNLQLCKPSIVYHWTFSQWFDSIKNIGLVVPNAKNGAVHKTDKGFYGRGIYTSPDKMYAMRYGNCSKVFVCLSLTGKRYEAHYPQDLGIPLKNGYDSHYSSNRNQMEWVFFKTNQLLLLYLIDYTKINNTFLKHLDRIIDCIVEPKIQPYRKEKVKKKDTKDMSNYVYKNVSRLTCVA